MKFLRMVGAMGLALALSACPAPVQPLPVPPPKATPSDEPVSAESARVGPMDGVWSAMDDQGQAFDLILFPNGQAVTTWTKGSTGARGERGWWRSTADGATIFFDDGWTDFLVQVGDGFRHRGYSPGTPTSGKPTNESPAHRVDGPEAAYVGIWWLNKEPDGSDLYVALQSGGRAFSTINPGEGKWTATAEGALCEWSDGWTDLITLTPEGYRKRSWVGSPENATPADISPVRRVGAEKFSVVP